MMSRAPVTTQNYAKIHVKLTLSSPQYGSIQKHEENQLPGGALNQLVTLGSKMPRRVAQNARFERFQEPPRV